MPKKVLLLIAQEGFDDDEYRVTRELLLGRGVDVAVAAGERDLARGAGGQLAWPSVALRDVRVADHDAVIVIGGGGALRDLWGRKEVQQIIGGAALEHRLIGAIGLGAILPAQIELLVDKDVACEPREEALAELRKHHARWVDVAVAETDNGVITARDSGAVHEFAHLVADRLGLAPSVESTTTPPPELR